MLRIKISRKEAKESAYWLRLIHESNSLTNADDTIYLIQEANELKKILSSILGKAKQFLVIDIWNLLEIWCLKLGIYFKFRELNIGILALGVARLRHIRFF